MTLIPRYAFLLPLLLGLLCAPSHGAKKDSDPFSDSGSSPGKEAGRAPPTTPGEAFRDCDVCPEMVVIPAGTFTMGSPESERLQAVTGAGWTYPNEGPQHEVTIAYQFAVGRYEVTFDEWDACHDAGGCSKYPEDDEFGRLDLPVINISRHDAKEYLAWLSEKTGATYRLLTESEWEYAARAGTTTAYHWGNDVGSGNANCQGCGGEWDDGLYPAPVGSFPANKFGLHDMLGNVFEMVEDCYSTNYEDNLWSTYEKPKDGSAWGRKDGDVGGDCYFVVRGGSTGSSEWIDGLGWTGIYEIRSAYRNYWFDGENGPRGDIGFRVARTLD